MSNNVLRNWIKKLGEKLLSGVSRRSARGSGLGPPSAGRP